MNNVGVRCNLGFFLILYLHFILFVIIHLLLLYVKKIYQCGVKKDTGFLCLCAKRCQNILGHHNAWLDSFFWSLKVQLAQLNFLVSQHCLVSFLEANKHPNPTRFRCFIEIHTLDSTLQKDSGLQLSSILNRVPANFEHENSLLFQDYFKTKIWFFKTTFIHVKKNNFKFKFYLFKRITAVFL